MSEPNCRRVTISRLESPGNYSNVKIELTDEVRPDETNEAALRRVTVDVAKAMTQAVLRREAHERLAQADAALRYADAEIAQAQDDPAAAALVAGPEMAAGALREACHKMDAILRSPDRELYAHEVDHLDGVARAAHQAARALHGRPRRKDEAAPDAEDLEDLDDGIPA